MPEVDVSMTVFYIQLSEDWSWSVFGEMLFDNKSDPWFPNKWENENKKKLADLRNTTSLASPGPL